MDFVLLRKTGGADILLELLRVCVGEVFDGRIFGEEGGRDLIDAYVRALSGKNRRDEQLKRVFVNKGAGRIGIGFVEAFQNGLHAPRVRAVPSRAIPAAGFGWALAGGSPRTGALFRGQFLRFL